MSKSDALIENVNNVIYTELETVLRSMNKRYYFSMYMMFLEKGTTCKEVKRIKKTVSVNKQDEFEVMQENLLSIESVLRELYLASFQNTEGNQFVDELKQAIDQQVYQVPIVEQSEPMLAFDNDEMQLFQPSKSEAERVSENRNLYSNNIDIRIGKVKHTLVYILEIINLDENTRSLFYDKPQLSFLRMVLDYFFVDYFIDLDSHKSITEGQIEKRYNEDSTQFIRRVTRLFFGKIHGFIRESGHRLGEGKDMFVNKTANEYYVSNLMESIDDISTHTYEGSSPFGSILFIDTRIMSKGLDLIKFAIKFKEEDRIQLNDSKRIRKLLELTNEEKDLYLIADQQSIYGLGEVKWGQLGNDELFRVDFKGLSKYNLVLVNTEDEKPQNDGTIVHHADEKTYQVTRDIKIQDKNLVSVSFKTPSLGEAGDILEKFKKLISHQFYGNKVNDEQEAQVKKLVKVVGKAREQKHGTMVVITENTTAEKELVSLKKQSTLIEPIEINPNYIKYLTSIDGAIYFDKTGVCHAIGVILDGLANENVGEASRGARYNSAYRYFHKLKNDDKKCVIAIVSEDGMVDLIPENSEEKLHLLVREIMDLISEHQLEDHEDLLIRIQELEMIENVDCDLYFRIADRFYIHEMFDKALYFYKKGFVQAGNIFVASSNYFRMGLCYHKEKDEGSLLNALDCYSVVINRNDTNYVIAAAYYNTGLVYGKLCEMKNFEKEYDENYKKMIHELINAFTKRIEIETERVQRNDNIYFLCHDWRGWGYYALTQTSISDNEKLECHKKAINDYTTFLEYKEVARVYRNRSRRYLELGMLDEAVKDIINAETLASDSKDLKKLRGIIDKELRLLDVAIQHYNVIRTESRDGSELRALLESYPTQSTDHNYEAAPTAE